MTRPIHEVITPLIGVPYKAGGQSPDEGFDCYSLVRHVLVQTTGIELPKHPSEVIPYLDEIWWVGEPPMRIQPLDIVLLRRFTVVGEHVGVAVDPMHFVHARGRVGVAIEQ